MRAVKNFFSNLGFDFSSNLLKPDTNFFADIPNLGSNIFFYRNPNQANTSFYLITTELDSENLKKLRTYIWNENKADLIFLTTKNGKKNTLFDDEALDINLYYAKANPLESLNNFKIGNTFYTSDKDLTKLERIKKWQFDSGSFWFNVTDFLNKLTKAKYRTIDKELVYTLASLKQQLTKIINDEKIVQALIDRTMYIKYLEDNHIINSSFRDYYFKDSKVDFKFLLEKNDVKEINKLFQYINEIFNNNLFDDPKIDNTFLNADVCKLLHSALSRNLNTQQLSLFDFKFNILPVEFISYIYEIFLSKEQKANGIYYTPKKLAQLIVDDVIPEGKVGRVLDPACGSGMFLVVAFQKLLENNPPKSKQVNKIIEHRLKILSENIFGVEKQLIAKRFTLFSLSLQVFRGLDFEQIKNYIATSIKQHGSVDLFRSYNFYNNILHENSLDIINPPFDNQKFDFIVGNPPFVGKGVSTDAKNFTDGYSFEFEGKKITAKSIVDGYQISQCFLLKIKEWSHDKTRFGFISNSSNFYNDSDNFQNYFYSNYGIEKIYELSRVKQLLFENAEESVVTIIFTNNCNYNNINYYQVDCGVYSTEPFKLLIIQEDKGIQFKQEKLISKQIRFRDFLIGNEFDRNLVSQIGENPKISNYTTTVQRGFEIWGEDARKREFNLSNSDWKSFNSSQKEEYLKTFIDKYFSTSYSEKYNKSYLKPSKLKPFVKKESTQFISNIDNFHRPRVNREIYLGQKLIFTRIGSKLNCVYSTDNDYFDFSVYTIKLTNETFYYLFQAVLNSNIVEFYLNFYLRKRMFDSFPRIGNDDILNIPIPKELDEYLVEEISLLSKDLTDGKIDYEGTIKEKLNDLIYDLYDLSYLEKQRVKDYFKEKAIVSKAELETYKEALQDTIQVFLSNPVIIEYSKKSDVLSFNITVFAIYLNNKKGASTGKVAKYYLNEIFSQNPNENFLVNQGIIFGKECVYIIKENSNLNWTETKAFEDGQEILKRLGNG